MCVPTLFLLQSGIYCMSCVAFTRTAHHCRGLRFKSKQKHRLLTFGRHGDRPTLLLRLLSFVGAQLLRRVGSQVT